MAKRTGTKTRGADRPRETGGGKARLLPLAAAALALAGPGTQALAAGPLAASLKGMTCAAFQRLDAGDRIALVRAHEGLPKKHDRRPAGRPPQASAANPDAATNERLRQPMAKQGSVDTRSLNDIARRTNPKVAKDLRAIGSYCTTTPNGLVVNALSSPAKKRDIARDGAAAD